MRFIEKEKNHQIKPCRYKNIYFHWKDCRKILFIYFSLYSARIYVKSKKIYLKF